MASISASVGPPLESLPCSECLNVSNISSFARLLALDASLLSLLGEEWPCEDGDDVVAFANLEKSIVLFIIVKGLID